VGGESADRYRINFFALSCSFRDADLTEGVHEEIDEWINEWVDEWIDKWIKPRLQIETFDFVHLLRASVMENKEMEHSAFPEVISEIRRFVEIASDLASIQQFCVDQIAARLPDYDWVGFYMIDPDDENVLVLGPYCGAPTEHVRIPVTEGICGAAVAQGEVVIVDDVSSDPRYLACSLETKSEIVVPIRASGKIIGEIDVDSHRLNAFGAADRDFLEQCATLIGNFVEK
jgi:L-methionine (R)-S-oxide reductase